MERDFERLKNRYNLKKLKIWFSRRFMHNNMDGFFISILNEIVLKDRRRCQPRVFTLLHEMCHAIQYREHRFVDNKRDTRKMYDLECEAELFAITEYNKIYKTEFGTLKNPWDLAPYDTYRQFWVQRRKHLETTLCALLRG